MQLNSLNSLKMSSMASLNQQYQESHANDDKNSNTADYAFNSEYFAQINSNQTNPFQTTDDRDKISDSDSTLHAKDSSTNDDISSADLHIIAHVSNLVSVQIDHYQYLFLLRLAEEITELSTFLAVDSKRILQERDESKSIIIGCVVPQVEVTMVRVFSVTLT